jgi:hypothetical protein
MTARQAHFLLCKERQHLWQVLHRAIKNLSLCVQVTAIIGLLAPATRAATKQFMAVITRKITNIFPASPFNNNNNNKNNIYLLQIYSHKNGSRDAVDYKENNHIFPAFRFNNTNNNNIY